MNTTTAAPGEIISYTLVVDGEQLFAGASIFGYTTKKNLAPMAGFMVMAIIGLVIAGILFLVFKFNQNRSNNLQMLLSNQPPSVFLETDKKSVEEMRKLTKQRVGGDPLE